MDLATIFVTVGAVFWGVVLNSCGHYHLFDTAEMCTKSEHSKYALRRVGIGIMLLNALPFVYIFSGYKMFEALEGIRFGNSIFAMIGALGLMGIPRIIHGLFLWFCLLPEELTHVLVDKAKGRSDEWNQPAYHIVPGVLILAIGWCSLLIACVF